MEMGYRKSIAAHPYDRQLFNPLETEASTPELNPILLLVAALMIYMWWRTSLGPGSYLAQRGAVSSNNVELQSNQYYGGTGRGYLPVNEPHHLV
mmetsp:Transcript_24343/g.39211  ORF Transcript_24343/g.39211 Transcript_24343/m.39211 type:complete len:94 (+) Transcript_24343:21-302(+)